MQLYQVLGVRLGAGDDEIKAAFRSLAKQLHPDLNQGNADADQRLRAVIRAYQTLSDPPSRTAYDAHLVGQRALRRWRFAARATTTITVFALTVGIGLFWRELTEAVLGHGIAARLLVDAARPHSTQLPDRPTDVRLAMSPPDLKPAKAQPQPDGDLAADPAPNVAPEVNAYVMSAPSEAKPPVIGDTVRQAVVPTPSTSTATAAVSPAPSKTDDGWASYRDTRFGFALGYPYEMFLPDPEPSDDGKSFVSRDGRARLLISAAINAQGLSLAQHRQSLMQGVYKSATFDYKPQRGTWFVLSGVLGTDMFYERVTFSCGGQALHGWKLVYPLSERAIYDRIVEEVHRRYRHGDGLGRCGRG